jgi:hypothetical protein
MNRHKVASINIRRRARMRGYPHSSKPEASVMEEL